MQVPTLLTRAMTDEEARTAAAWSYPAPFDLYTVDPNNTALFTNHDDTGHGYYPALDQHRAVIAFCVLGPEARVHGQHPHDHVLDVDLGVRPDLVSRGLASQLLPQVATLACDLFDPIQLRTAVATFNERSLALCHKAGFNAVRDFTGPAGRTFRELTRPLDSR